MTNHLLKSDNNTNTYKKHSNCTEILQEYFTPEIMRSHKFCAGSVATMINLPDLLTMNNLPGFALNDENLTKRRTKGIQYLMLHLRTTSIRLH
jgi:hypothetical protein